MSHTRMRRSEILLEYVESLGVADMEVFYQAATYDIYSRENAKKMAGVVVLTKTRLNLFTASL